VTNTKQEEAGIYTLDKKVLLFLGPLAFRKKKGKIHLIGTKCIFFIKHFFANPNFWGTDLLQIIGSVIQKTEHWILFRTNRIVSFLAMSDC
jgi:hypothetical protein